MSEMTLEEYTSEPVSFQCGTVCIEPRSREENYLNVTILAIDWVSVAFELSRCDDDFIDCFINRVRKMQSTEPLDHNG
jgi:hypothetical protein